jgi:hypothetical protein
MTETATAPDVSGSPTLARLMAMMPDYSAEFGGTYANHAPMALVALDRLGARGDRLAAFFRTYRDAKGLRPAPPRIGPLTRETWPEAVGERARESDLVAFFEGEVDALGTRGALHAYLPRLIPGVGASAFHALMRLAYALIDDNRTEVAIALGYWAATYLPMPPATGAPPVTEDPAEVLAMVSRIEALHDLPVRELLWQNIRESGQCPDFAPVIDWLAVGPDTPARMAGASIALFAATQEFCALHAVTGMHWVRIVLPYCPDGEPLLRAFWQGIAGLMRQMAFPSLPDARTCRAWRALPVPPWAEIEAAAARSDDEHDISLVFSAREEMAVYGDPLYQLAAARRVGLVPAYAEGV